MFRWRAKEIEIELVGWEIGEKFRGGMSTGETRMILSERKLTSIEVK